MKTSIAENIWRNIEYSALPKVLEVKPIGDLQTIKNLALRLILRDFSRANQKERQRTDYLGSCNSLASNLAGLFYEQSKLPASVHSQLVKEIETCLLFYPFNMLDSRQFYYLNNERPSFFVCADATGEPLKCDRTELHRNYHITGELPSKTYTVTDAESAVSVDVRSRFLLDVTLPWDVEIWYVDETMHRKVPSPNARKHRRLIVNKFLELNRYDLHNLEDIKVLKSRGLFQAFPNSYSNNKISLAQWYQTQQNLNYSQDALWALLEIDHIPHISFPPYNRQ